MDQPLRVGRGQAGRHLHADAQDLFDRERPVPVESLLQRHAGDVLHDQVRQAVRLLDRVDGDDVLVAHRGGGPGLALEALSGFLVRGPLRRQHLDRRHALQGRVERLEDHAHAAATDHAQHFVRPQTAKVFGPGRWTQERKGRDRGRPGRVQPGLTFGLELFHRPTQRRPRALFEHAGGLHPASPHPRSGARACSDSPRTLPGANSGSSPPTPGAGCRAGRPSERDPDTCFP